MKKLSILICLIVSSFTALAQYEVKTIKRPDGITLKYFNPIPVIRTSNYEAGLSLYKNSDNDNYFVTITVLFKKNQPEELTGNLIIQTTGKKGLSLNPVYNKLLDMNGRDVAVSMYYLTDSDINELKKNPLKLISFNVNEEIIALNLNENKDLLIKEFSILSSNERELSNRKKTNKSKVDPFLEEVLKSETYKNWSKNPSNVAIAVGNAFNYEQHQLDFDSSNQGYLDENTNPPISLENNQDNIFSYTGLVFGLILSVILFFFVLFSLGIQKKDKETKQSVNDNKSKNKLNDSKLTEEQIKNIYDNETLLKKTTILNPHKKEEISESKAITINSQKGAELLNSKINYPGLNISKNDNTVEINSKADLNDNELKTIGYKPSTLFDQVEPYKYPMVKMPKVNSYIKFPKKGRTNKLGFTEKGFDEVLNKYFSTDFRVYNDRHITQKNSHNIYEPDFLMIDEKGGKNIFINIEIDEPYDGVSRFPTHEINRDTYRDLFFTNRGYIVIRFNEKQIFEEPKECCVFIAEVIKSIDENYSNYKLGLKSTISLQNQWDTLQSKKWSFEKYRENYLGIESFNIRPSIQFNFSIENSELDIKVESLINDIDIISIDENDNKPLNGNKYHERDKRIVFDSTKHKYYIDGNPDTISVSELIDKFFPEFDPKTAAENLNPNHELYGLPVDKIIAIWKQKGNISAELGTNLHQQIENYYKGLKYDSNSKEFKYFLDFKERYAGMNPERTEWRIFDEDYLIAGTIDMLYKKDDGTYYIFDWKRSEKVIHQDGKLKISDPEHFYTRFAFGELNHLTDDSYYKYALQQNIYRHILETKYNRIISSMNLLILHPNYETYHWLKLPRMQNEIEYIFSILKHNS